MTYPELAVVVGFCIARSIGTPSRRSIGTFSRTCVDVERNALAWNDRSVVLVVLVGAIVADVARAWFVEI